ncbi:hypothetical protein GS876_10385 [Rhodococcus hoagii]|nr:hypothetical protein [Prescottella equi]NKT31591.1 hypothetical protein [Prescottella equi]NKT39257.1 hypothetical protein [Prescottella equi]NKT72923.1 hypothetical protein [Prescottella equi]NKT75885.1 hypothetical protein [Prescottella equi]
MTMTALLVCDDFPTLAGRQEPHHLSIFDGDITYGEQAVELGRRAGAISMPWQAAAQHAILSTTPDGRWTHADCCLIIPRQNGKSEILILRCLYGLFKLDETIIYTAQRWKTARDAWKRMMSLIKSRSWLKKRVVRSTCSQGEGIIELASGASISFGTRSNDSGRGLTDVDLVVFDEAYNLTPGEISAMSFVQMAAKNPQTIYASSAVNQSEHPNGEVLTSVRVRGLAREPGLYFAEYMAPDDMDREDEGTWRYCNPSYGVIQTPEKIRKIMRNLATPAGRKGFDVEALGRGDWPVLKEEKDTWQIVAEQQWKGLVDFPELTGTIGVGVARVGAQWVVAGAQRTVDDRIHVEVAYVRIAPNPEIVELIGRVDDTLEPCAIATDSRSPAVVLEPLMKTAGIELIKSTTNQAALMCQGLVDDADDGLISHTGQAALDYALEHASKRVLPRGDWVIDPGGDPGIAPALAVAVARWALLTFESRVTGAAATPAYQRARSVAGEPDSFDALTVAF